MEINIPTEQDIFRNKAIQYVNKAFVYITDCNPSLNNLFNNYLRSRLPICKNRFVSLLLKPELYV